MALIYKKYITREDLQNNPDDLFVFGDNLKRAGFGGQAKEMRGEPNAVGIPTKISPNMTEDAFLKQYHFGEWYSATRYDLYMLRGAMYSGANVIWPMDGIGTGLANLKNNSPKIWKVIDEFRKELQAIAEFRKEIELNMDK